MSLTLDQPLPIADLAPNFGDSGSHYMSITELGLLVQAIGDRPDLWLSRLRRPEGDRWWMRLHGDDRVDVWLLTWLPGHTTELHDHGSSAAAFSVLRGRFEETRLSTTGHRSILAKRAGATSRVPIGVIHDVVATAGDPAASIHAYSPPLHEMTYYAAAADGRLRPDRTVTTNNPEA